MHLYTYILHGKCTCACTGKQPHVQLPKMLLVRSVHVYTYACTVCTMWLCERIILWYENCCYLAHGEVVLIYIVDMCTVCYVCICVRVTDMCKCIPTSVC